MSRWLLTASAAAASAPMAIEASTLTAPMSPVSTQSVPITATRPKPIAYTPFGELTVFVFFGLVAVMGTDWVLTGDIGAVSLLASIAIGALAAAALAVNNHRDIAHDRLVGRRTFAVTFGDAASRHLYTLLLLGPFVLLLPMALLASAPALLLPLLLLPAALQLRRDFGRTPPGTAFNEILFRTFRLELWFAALLSAGALLARVLG